MNEDLGYLKYAPLSPEFLEYIWQEDDLQIFSLTIDNHIYVPTVLLITMLEEKYTAIHDLTDDYGVYEQFFRSLMGRPEMNMGYASNSSWMTLIRNFASIVILRPHASRDLLLKILKITKIRHRVIIIAAHPNLPIEDSIEILISTYEIGLGDNVNVDSWHSRHKETIISKCDDFLRRYGWDEVALSVTDLTMKMKIIGV